MSVFATGRYHDGQRWTCVLWRAGRTKVHVTFIDETGVLHRALPMSCQRYIRPLSMRGREYPLSRMVRHLTRVGRERGITQAARTELQEAMSS